MSGDLSGFSIFDLYKGEAASHVAALNEGLLAIEANPADLSHVEQLMRAAHSIKGAASIADIHIIVELAHAMEDCFVDVQKGVETLTSVRVDQLLSGVDVIGETSQLAESELDDWQSLNTHVCRQLCESLRRPASELDKQPESEPDVDSETETAADKVSGNDVEETSEPPAVEPPPPNKTQTTDPAQANDKPQATEALALPVAKLAPEQLAPEQLAPEQTGPAARGDARADERTGCQKTVTGKKCRDRSRGPDRSGQRPKS